MSPSEELEVADLQEGDRVRLTAPWVSDEKQYPEGSLATVLITPDPQPVVVETLRSKGYVESFIDNGGPAWLDVRDIERVPGSPASVLRDGDGVRIALPRGA